MDGSRQTERSEVALRRIVAWLFALADMAERAADAPHRVRSVVLMILRLAEPAAQGIIFETGYGQPALAAYDNDSPADALRLAERFRALAALLLSLTAQALASWEDRPSGLLAFDEPGTLRRPAWPAPARALPDTS
ncbi:MAG TPA: hypothetical protein VIU14_14385 [Mesorhizobium sp.]